MATMEQNRRGYVVAEDVIQIGPFAIEQCEPVSQSLLSIQRILYSGKDISTYERASSKMIEDGLAKII